MVFHHSAEEPARCALEISEALRKHPEIPVRTAQAVEVTEEFVSTVDEVDNHLGSGWVVLS